jgi:uncharacterized protein YjbI with pentapeptide repeats
MPRNISLLWQLFHLLPMPMPKKTPTHATQVVTDKQKPLSTDREAGGAYLQSKNQSWRTEPKITIERQHELDGRRKIIPDIPTGTYPFKDMKLNRADVEWLLATHDNGRGPVDWSDESQRQRIGLNLCGADLRGADLSNLPLARILGNLSWDEWTSATNDQREVAAIHLEGSNLIGTHLEGALLMQAHLEKSLLREAHLNNAQLNKAHLEGATAIVAHLEHSIFYQAHMEEFDGYGAHLEDANLARSSLTGAKLNFAHLERTNLLNAHLEKTELRGTHLEGANMETTHLEGTILCRAFFDRATQINKILLSNKQFGCVSLADVRWGDVNLTAIKWSQVEILGDEVEARQKMKEGKKKDKALRLEEHETAVRANRQLSVVLQAQGLNEEATRFAYRAQVLQKTVLRLQIIQPAIRLKQRSRSFWSWLISWVLFLLAGYGYRAERSFLAYLFVISVFTILYHLIAPQLLLNEAFVISMTAFHGRGFFPSTFSPGDPLALASAFEAFVGLIIEVTFIATLTQRFFGK